MKKLKTVFMGTPDFAIDSLKVVFENTDLKLIITKEDKVNKRGNKIEYSPVKKFAMENNIEFIQPKSIKTDDFYNKLKEINPDVIVVVAYGKIIPKNIIELPKHIINVHSSILPKYRGASPIHNAIINGDTKTGVTIMYIEEELDSGDIINTIETDITEEDTLETLHDRLKVLGSKALYDVIKNIEKDNVVRIKQNHELATYVYPIKKEETKINFSKTKEEIFNLVRGLYPSPLTFTTLKGKIVKILEVKKDDSVYDGEFGEIVNINKNDIYIKVSNGCILLKKVKFEGKKEQNSKDLINGRMLKIGDRFE